MIANFPLHRLVFPLLLCLCALVYWPGLSGGFVFDDTQNLLYNDELKAVDAWRWSAIRDAAWSSEAGMFKRPVSMFTFALNHAATGLDPWFLKLTNLFIHLLAGLGFFFYARALTDAMICRGWATPAVKSIVPLLALTLWLLHPLQLTSVLYVIQRMASLATLFIAWGLASYTVGRMRQSNGQQGGWHIAAAYFVFLPLAALSKENGVLLTPLLFLTEWIFFKFDGLSADRKKLLALTHGVFFILPALAALIFLATHPGWITAGYVHRDFDLAQRLLTQTRVFWFYVGMIFFPNIKTMGLYHDDFQNSASIFDPWSTSAAILGLVFLIFLAWKNRHQWPLLIYAFGFFIIGHAMESTILPLEMIHEHRNYLPSFGLMFGAAYGLFKAWQSRPQLRRIIVFLTFAMALCLALLTGLRAANWGNDFQRAIMEAENHPQSSRALIDAGGAFLLAANEAKENRQPLLLDARKYYGQAVSYDPRSVVAWVGYLVATNKLGLTIDDRQADEFIRQVSATPMIVSTPDAIVSLIMCDADGDCRFDVNFLLRMAHAIVHHPQISMISRGRVQMAVAQGFINKKDYSTALAFIQDALNAGPQDAQLRLNYADVLLGSGIIDEGRRQLDIVEKMPLANLYRERLSDLRQKHQVYSGDSQPVPR